MATLHVVDLETNFNDAMFLKNHTVEGVWDSFVTCCEALYIRFSMKMRLNQGSAFNSVRWKHRDDGVRTVVQTSGVESHNSIGSGERYHAQLRRVFNKIILEDPKIERKMALQLAVKARNDTMGPEGFVHSYLGLGCIQRFPAVDSTVPNQKYLMNSLEKARNEMATIVAELRLKTALASRVTQNSDLSIAAGDLGRVFRKTDKRYVGLFPIIQVDGKQVFVLQGNREVQFSIHQVLLAADYDAILYGQNLVDTLHCALPFLCSTHESRKRRDRKSSSNILITEVLHHSDKEYGVTKLKRLEGRRLKILFTAVLGKWFSRKMCQKTPTLSPDLSLS